MKLKPYLIIYILILFPCLKAVSQTKELSSVLIKLYDGIQFTGSDVEKERLNDSIVLILGGYAASDSVFSYKFKHVFFLGEITSSDSRIKIITWNLLLRSGNRYFCYFIRKGERGKGNSVFKLKGEHRPEPIATDRLYSTGDWYGALYYAIVPCKKDYILLGLDFGEVDSRKMIDVLSFTPEGTISFGKDLFIRENVKRFREVIEYSSQSVVSLRFDTPKLIVFDHLASFSSGEEEEAQSVGSGLSYDGYSYKNGVWLFTTGIDARNPKK